VTGAAARAILSLALAAAVFAPATFAAEPRASLPDIEDEVMCVQCNTPLNLSTAAVADRERAFIRREIARGRTKEQIKDALVDRFGPSVLAVPEEEGFGLTAYIVPIAFVLIAFAGVLVAARRWRLRATPVSQGPRELDRAEADRLERELARYD
jgi:cytochrome c-type biogenesis protein CcmH